MEEAERDPAYPLSDSRGLPGAETYQERLIAYFLNALRNYVPRDFNSCLNFTRRFVNRNSRHEGSLVFSVNDLEGISCHMLTSVQDPTKEKPTLYCSERTKIAQILLASLGIITSKTDIFTFWDPHARLSHTFLEAQNPGDLSWQILDSDYGIYTGTDTEGWEPRIYSSFHRKVMSLQLRKLRLEYPES